MAQIQSSDLIILLFQVSVMLGCALLFGQLMRKLNQPSVLGELIGGIIIGPTVLGVVAPGIYQGLFPANPSIAQERDVLPNIGMLFFLFSAGLEMNLTQIQQRKWKIVLISALGFLIPFTIGFGAVILAPDFWNHTAASATLTLALFIGTALSITALPVITRILVDLSLLDQEVGIMVISSATIDDLIGWSLFAVIISSLSAAHSDRNFFTVLIGIVLFAILVIGFGRRVGGPVLRWAHNTLAWPTGLISLLAIYILIVSAAAEAIGIHAIFGAFIVGVSLNVAFKKNEETRIQEIIHQFVISIFAPLYFVSIGLKTNFIANFDLPLVLVVIAIATIGKLVGASLGALISGIPLRDSIAIGFGMNARGAIELILATVALEHQLIDQRIFVALVTMALVTSMASAPLMQLLMKKTLQIQV
jgi:Kef-type K+ transport system membrane component KefB